MSVRKLMAAMALVLGVMGLLAANAFGNPQSSSALGFCGPGFTSKAQAVAYYASHPGSVAESYMRANASYYHIQADQSFASYLNSPHVKAFAAPAGYQLSGNTYCPTSNSIAPYHGKLSVGGVMMLWWCSDTRGYNCVPIAKGYCNNMVHGRMIRPVPTVVAQSPSEVPVRVCKTTDAATSQVFTINLNGKSFKITGNSCISVAFRSVGFQVQVSEVPVDGWTVHAPFTFTVRRGLQVDIVNHKIAAPPPIAPTTPTFVCTINGVGQTSVPPGYQIVNGQCVQLTVTVSCPSGSTGTPPNCVVQTNQAAQACQGMNGTWTNNGDVSFCVIQQGQCTINVYINGNGNVVNSQTVSCNTTTSPTTTAPPPTPVTLTLSNLTQPQNGSGGIAPDGEGPISVCVTVQGKAGDVIKVPFSTTYGSFSALVTITSTGVDRVCTNYTAPNDSADVGKTETWTASGTDVTANVNATPISTSFTFQSPPNGGSHP